MKRNVGGKEEEVETECDICGGTKIDRRTLPSTDCECLEKYEGGVSNGEYTYNRYRKNVKHTNPKEL